MNVVKNHPQVNLRLPPELKEWLHHKAISEHRSMNNLVVMILEREAKKENPPVREH